MNRPRLEVTLLTPPGRSAVAVVRVDGPDAIHVLATHFRRAGDVPLTQLPEGRLAVGHWGVEPGEQVVVVRFDDHSLEIHCHGGLAAAGKILDDLKQAGARAVSWSDWLDRQYSDPIRRAAAHALPRSPTKRTATHLLAQFQGALRQEIERIIQLIDRGHALSAQTALEDLVSSGDVGLHLVAPYRVVLAGPPNVGKSSLINALMGYERAIVFDQPGTTRDVVAAQTAIDGWPVELADTAGLRMTNDMVEHQGIELAHREIESADLVVWVADARDIAASDAAAVPNPTPPTPAAQRSLCVANKIDLAIGMERHAPAFKNWLATSAVTGQGIDDLVHAASRSLVPYPPAAMAAVPFTRDQVEGLQLSRDALAANCHKTASRRLFDLLGPPTQFTAADS